MTKILAYDTATKTGVCFGSPGEKPRAWSFDLGDVAWPRRYGRLLDQVGGAIEKLQPTIVAVEAPVGGPKANANLVGLAACVQGEAARRGVDVVTYFPATIRKHFLSGIRTAGPIKTQVYRKCIMLGWDVPDTDSSDAAALWDYVCSTQSRAHQMTTVGGLFNDRS